MVPAVEWGPAFAVVGVPAGEYLHSMFGMLTVEGCFDM